MESARFEEMTVDRCIGCHGLWFDALELESVVAGRGGRKLDIGDAEVGKQLDSTDRIECPRCRISMIRLVDSRHPEVRYEQCSVCGGAFLDAGELTAIEKRTLGEVLRGFLGL